MHTNMESTPSKRRKVSPSRLLSQSDVRSPAVRPSYLSPTKASIAHFYPSLVSRAKSSEPPLSTSLKAVSNGGHRSQVEDVSGDYDGGGKIRYSSEPIGLPPGDILETTSKSILPQENVAAVIRRSQSRIPKAHVITGNSTHSQQEEEPASSFNNTSSIPYQGNARHVDEAVAYRTNDPADISTIDKPISDQRSPTSTRHARLMDAPNHGDKQQIPAAPSLPDISDKSPSDSTSRRPRRRGRQGPNQSPNITNNAHLRADNLAYSSYALGSKTYLQNLPAPAPTAEEEQRSRSRLAIMHAETKLLAIERKLMRKLFLTKWNDNVSKDQSEKDKLHARLKTTAENVIEMRSKNGPPISLQLIDSPAKQARSSTPARIPSDSAVVASPSLRASVLAYLPFNIHLRRTKDYLDHTAEAIAEPLDDEDRSSPVSIHFTDTTLSLLSSIDNHSGLVYRSAHQVDFRSPKDLVIAKIRLDVDSPSMTMVDFGSLELAPWAVREIGPFLEHTRVEQLSLTKIGTAVGRWWQITCLRAEIWHTCLGKYPDLASLNPCPLALRAAVPQGLSLISQIPVSDRMDLDCDNIEFARGLVKLIIGWELRPDDNGDVKSRVFAKPEFPETWSRSSNFNIGLSDHVKEVFQLLVKEKGVLAAICVIVEILFASG